MRNFMLDMETLALCGAPLPLSIAVVEFTMDGAVNAGQQWIMSRADRWGSPLAVDPGTEAWWQQQSQEVRAIFDVPESERIRLRDALMLLERVVPADAILWTWGVDWLWLQSIYFALNLPFPWNVKNVRDCRTLCKILPLVEVPAGEKKHDALADCHWQIAKVTATLRAAGLVLQ